MYIVQHLWCKLAHNSVGYKCAQDQDYFCVISAWLTVIPWGCLINHSGDFVKPCCVMTVVILWTIRQKREISRICLDRKTMWIITRHIETSEHCLSTCLCKLFYIYVFYKKICVARCHQSIHNQRALETLLYTTLLRSPLYA